MDIREIAQKLFDNYKTAKPIYGNKDKIYGNTTNIHPTQEQVYEFMCWLHKNKPNVYANIANIISGIDAELAKDTLTYLAFFAPDEYKELAATLVFVLSIFLHKHSKN